MPPPLPLVGIIAAIVLGLIGLFRPAQLGGQVGLTAASRAGVTELRALLGGSILASALACLALREPAAYLVAGLAFLGGAAAKAFGLALDRPPLKAVAPGLVVDLAIGALLASGWLGR